MPHHSTKGTLELVRSSLVAGVLLLATVAWIVHRNATPAGNTDLVTLRRVTYALAVGALAATIVLRSLIARAATYERAVSLTIAAWAIAELPAIAGAAHYLFTGSAATFAVATLAFVAALLLVGIPEP